MIIKYKLSDVAKDLAVSNKQVTDLLQEKFGEVKKHATPLTEAELDYLFNHFTGQNQVNNFEEYIASAVPRPKPIPKPAAPQPVAPAKPPTVGKPAAASAKPTAPVVAAPSVPAPTAPQTDEQKQAAAKRPGQIPPKKRDPLGRDRKLRPEKENKVEAPKREVVTRTVDTRTVDVNLDKFNEKYNELASTRRVDTRKKPSPSNNRQKPRHGGRYGNRPMSSKKIETETEKLQRIQLEKARKAQLKVSIPDEITVGDLAARLKITAAQLIKKLMAFDVMASVSEMIDFDTASLMAEEFHAKVQREVHVSIEERLFEVDEDKSEDLKHRPPVVVVMGHVDHGKTSILDAIRKAQVTTGEAGGITQHIGAYQVVRDGNTITFLDTPGHEAFTSMRARGANLTDVAVLVVAADDGIMPQTIESINHAKSAGVTLIVVINKMDKETANPERIKQQLTEYEIVPEEWGGDTMIIPVSAATGEGIDTLLDAINLTAEMMDLKANPDRHAKGTVVEARLDKGQGPIATILIQNGTLSKGDVVIAGTAVGRVRTMRNADGDILEKAGPSTPVEITGLTAVPAAGDMFESVEDERLARELADRRTQNVREEQLSSYTKVTLDNLFTQIAAGDTKQLSVVVKADVQGSSEAVKQSLEKLSTEEVRVKVIHSGVGAISKSDVMLASASNAIIIGFNVRPDPVAKADAAQDQVEMRMYRVIYDAINDVEDAMKGMLEPKIREVEQGRIEVRQIYKVSSVGAIAGCYVLDGKVLRSSKIRVVRDGIVVAEDTMASLRRFKDDVKEVASGYECGITLEKFGDVKEGDIYEAFILEEYRD